MNFLETFSWLYFPKWIACLTDITTLVGAKPDKMNCFAKNYLKIINNTLIIILQYCNIFRWILIFLKFCSFLVKSVVFGTLRTSEARYYPTLPLLHPRWIPQSSTSNKYYYYYQCFLFACLVLIPFHPFFSYTVLQLVAHKIINRKTFHLHSAVFDLFELSKKKKP